MIKRQGNRCKVGAGAVIAELSRLADGHYGILGIAAV